MTVTSAVVHELIQLSHDLVQAVVDRNPGRLEELLAYFFGTEACLTFTTGYQALLGTISALVNRRAAAVMLANRRSDRLTGRDR